MQLLLFTNRVQVFLLLLGLSGSYWCVQAQGLTLQETSVVQLLTQAQNSLERGDRIAAAKLLTQVLDLQSTHHAARKTLIQVLLQQGKFSEAETHAQVLAQQAPGEPETFYLRGLIAFQQGKLEPAAEFATQCLTLNAKNPVAHKLLALTAYLQRQFEPFEQHIHTAARLDPLDPDPHYHLGRYYFEDKRYEDALREFKTVFQLAPNHYRARYYAGLVYEGQNEMAQAKEEMQTAIRLVEQSKLPYAWPFTDLGRLLVNEGEYERGLGWLYRAVRNDPASPYAHYNYAKALFRQGATFEVKAELDAALKLDPGYGDAWYLLGRYYQKAGRAELAKETFAKFEEIKKNPVPSPYGVRRW
jgi:tetratricopeptide (TPR) repeat protein